MEICTSDLVENGYSSTLYRLCRTEFFRFYCLSTHFLIHPYQDVFSKSVGPLVERAEMHVNNLSDDWLSLALGRMLKQGKTGQGKKLNCEKEWARPHVETMWKMVLAHDEKSWHWLKYGTSLEVLSWVLNFWTVINCTSISFSILKLCGLGYKMIKYRQPGRSDLAEYNRMVFPVVIWNYVKGGNSGGVPKHWVSHCPKHVYRWYDSAQC